MRFVIRQRLLYLCIFLLIGPLNLCDISANENLTSPKTAKENFWKNKPLEAIEQAKKEKKDILVLFTGSDWCPPCQKLEQEVFLDESFFDETEENYVYVKFDFLRNSPITPEAQKLNEQWAEKFGVDSFPTIVLIDADQKPYAFAGYEEGGVENFLGLVEESRLVRVRRDEKMAAAKKATGKDRAKLLDEAISQMPREISEVYYEEIIAEIIKIDEDDSLGLRTKWNEERDKEIRKAIITDVMMVARLESPQRAIEMVDEILGTIKFKTRQKLDIMQIKLGLVRELGKPEAVDALLDEMINLEGVEASARERLTVKKIYLMVGSKRKAAAIKLLDESIAAGERAGEGNAFLWACKGELLDAAKDYTGAVAAFDNAIANSKSLPDLLVEVISGKADALFSDGNTAEAMRTLDNFADDTDVPADLRAEALLHKSMLMRESGKLRTARLVENRAIEIIESTKEKTELQSVVESLRKKYEKPK